MVAAPALRWHLTLADTDGRLQRSELWIPPGAPAGPVHAHPREEERLELLSGTMELHVGGRRRTLERGDGTVIPAGAPHVWRNAGPGVLHFMVDLEVVERFPAHQIG